jgi:hypothetical protein
LLETQNFFFREQARSDKIYCMNPAEEGIFDAEAWIPSRKRGGAKRRGV